ncbi:hypothetical protein [Salegentibacter salarius]|uniref:Uncharacterized protein n=1 Tax=Salegentibacter salarius TaxID=435906 RepID=A0A2N0TNG7_9FLAO|nr:hypothetical protein [Salegentibacter salarius]OEY71482.1 hypothetical protein BHS39_04950 [Salegentibacter salarius]PKD16272.1 hypothetical protein APR40_04950 [Salegentibacter salarius]SLJ89816.1 hypothetical protein SAMN05660445_00881 [Salegentibacter salarius]
MRNIVIVVFILFSINVFGQKNRADNVIEMNSKFTLELQTEDSLTYTFKIVSKEPFTQEIEWSDGRKYLDSVSLKNQIQGILTRGKFGSRTSSILLIQNGLENSISYKLEIKVPQKRKLVKTSVVDLLTNVPSTELWPYMIEYVQFSNFTAAHELEEYVHKPQIDSSCIENKEYNIEYGNKLFIDHSALTINRLKSDKSFDLNELLQFEDSLKTEDVSLGHFWSLGEGIYPNSSDFTFGNPISYRRLECPYFDGTTNFFYTKEEKSVKVVSYGWKEFKKSGFPISENSDSEDKDLAFKEKYDFVLTQISKLLGEPISNVREDSGRRKTKWKSKTNMHAYLFNFSNINEIRLYIYKE